MSAQQENSKGLEFFAGLGGLTAIGIFIYAGLRLSYWSFYSRFGVTPEEVGLGYIEILTRSAPPLVLFMAAAAAVNGLLARGFSLTARRAWRVMAWTVVLFLLVVLTAGSVRAHTLADVVADGIPVHPRLFTELVAVQVDYVTLAPREKTAQERPDAVQQLPQRASSDKAEPDGIEGRTSLLYFGQSNQIAVLYDHVNQQVIRIPMADVTIIAE
jgi:hypothetical protein